MHSQVKASINIYDAWMVLQNQFVHIRKGDGRPTTSFFPVVTSPSSRGSILFSIRLGSMTNEDEDRNVPTKSILNIRYGVYGDKNVGTHTLVSANPGAEGELLFKSTLVL